MKRLPLALLIVLLAVVGPAKAGIIPFYKPGTEVGIFSMRGTRETLFQTLANVTLAEIGAVIDPFNSSSQFRWRIYNSDSNFTFASTIFDQTVSFTDVGLTTYDTSVNVNLNASAYYILSLQALTPGNMQRFNESNQGLPFTTIDGVFKVIDGADNRNPANTILPSFSVTSHTPEPSTFVLFGIGLLGLISYSWRRQKRTA